MVEAGALSGLSLFTRLFEVIIKKVKKDALKKELADALETPITNAEKSLDRLNFSFYQFIGAGVWGNIIEPVDPKESAQKIVDEIDNSYSEFIYNFKELSKYFAAHMDELREILTKKEILALEAYVKAFETNIPDYEFLRNHGAIKGLIVKEMRRKKTFNEELNFRLMKKFNENADFKLLSNTLNSPQVDTQQLIAETMTRILMEKYIVPEK